MASFQLQVYLRPAETSGDSRLEILLASSCPIFTPTALLIKENYYFVTLDSLEGVFFFPPVVVVVDGTLYV